MILTDSKVSSDTVAIISEPIDHDRSLVNDVDVSLDIVLGLIQASHEEDVDGVLTLASVGKGRGHRGQDGDGSEEEKVLKEQC